MATIESITHTLFVGLYDYVANRNKKSYREEFAKRKTYNTKFALEFFPKYVDFEKWSKNPKDPYDILLINYWMIEVPVVGLKYTNLFGSYSRGNRLLNKRLKNKKNSAIKIRSVKKKCPKPTKEEIPILSQGLLDLFNEEPKEKAVKKSVKGEFNNEQMYLHFADITDGVELNSSKDVNTSKKDFNILFRDKVITVDQSMLEFAISYFEFEKQYRLEAKTLMNELLIRIGEKHPRSTEYDIKTLFKEIISQKKYFNEKEELKKRVVWVNKSLGDNEI